MVKASGESMCPATGQSVRCDWSKRPIWLVNVCGWSKCPRALVNASGTNDVVIRLSDLINYMN